MAAQVAAQGIAAPLLLMLSSGGLTHVAEARRAPVQMLESGPAAGALAAAFFGREDSGREPPRLRHGRHHRQALAGGGRRAARRLQLRGGAAEAVRRGQRLPDPDLHHRADRDRRGRRQHRARSTRSASSRSARRARARSRARSSYGLGGAEPTVTDADFLLGYLDPGYFAGGEVAVDLDGGARRARTALARQARPHARPARLGHPRRRQREHGGRGARAHRRARARPARLRAALHGRRGAGARLLGGAEARHRAA